MSLMPTIDDSYLSVSVRGCSPWCVSLIYCYDYKGKFRFSCSPLFVTVCPCTMLGVVNGVVNFDDRKHET
ncbi:Uncharacterised protein [Escherichia coli]|nr:Uncharacterised protein [Escherichia coli]